MEPGIVSNLSTTFGAGASPCMPQSMMSVLITLVTAYATICGLNSSSGIAASRLALPEALVSAVHARLEAMRMAVGISLLLAVLAAVRSANLPW